MQELLTRNAEWVAGVESSEWKLFETMAGGQSPDFLWIGCADSRVPAEIITQSEPGAIFVQRNVANMVIHTDYNLLSVVNYAVTVLKVKHIVVCGHYGCGGVKAAMEHTSLGLLDNWVSHLKDVYLENESELDSITDENERWDRFVELNVRTQVRNMARLSFIQKQWRLGDIPEIHGLIFNVADGKLEDLGMSINSADKLAEIFRYD